MIIFIDGNFHRESFFRFLVLPNRAAASLGMAASALVGALAPPPRPVKSSVCFRSIGSGQIGSAALAWWLRILVEPARKKSRNKEREEPTHRVIEDLGFWVRFPLHAHTIETEGKEAGICLSDPSVNVAFLGVFSKI